MNDLLSEKSRSQLRVFRYFIIKIFLDIYGPWMYDLLKKFISSILLSDQIYLWLVQPNMNKQKWLIEILNLIQTTDFF